MDAILYNMAKTGSGGLLGVNCYSLDATSPNKNTALHIAARHGNIRFCVDISDLCPSLLLAQNSRGDTALHIAARAGNLPLVDKLIESCAEKAGVITAKEMLEKRNVKLNTALHEAAWNHHHTIVEVLTDAHPELVALVNGAGASPLYLAAEQGALQCVDYILRIRWVEYLQFAHGPDNRTPLHAAVIRGHLDVLEKLIQEMPSLIKQTDKCSNSPIHYAAYLGNLEMVRVLLQSDISTAYIMDEDGRSAFHVAAYNGHVDVLKELLRFCPDSSEVVDRKGRNALHVAVDSGKLEVMRFILKSNDLKELINEPDNEGNTPLHIATIKRHIAVLNLLLQDKRLDMRAINNNGMTALDIAESDKELTMKFRKIVICTALIQAGAPQGEQQQHIQANKVHAKDTEAPRIESYRALSKVILVVAGLIITVTFAASFTIPGGYNGDGSNKGMAILTRKPTFWAFVITDSIALFSSITVALLLIWAGIGDQDLLVSIISIAGRLMAIALGSLTLAFLSGIWLVASKWLGIVILCIFIIILFLSLHSFCFHYSLLPLFFKQIISNYFHSQMSSAVPSLEKKEGKDAVQYMVKSKYVITNLERLFFSSRGPSDETHSVV